MLDNLQLVSIVLEVVIALLCLRAAWQGRPYMAALALTFAIYVFYDLARLFEWSLPDAALTVPFFVATVAALYTVWRLQSGHEEDR